MYLSFLLDVEDFVSPEADDIAKTVAELLTEAGVPVTLTVVGERARQWRAVARDDEGAVVDAAAAPARRVTGVDTAC